MIDKELMQQALDALITAEIDGNCEYGVTDSLRTRLAQPEQEPVGYYYNGRFSTEKNAPGIGVYGVPVYTTPPQREWQGLTDEEVKDVVLDNPSTSYELFGLIRDDVTVSLFRRAISDFIRAIEAKLKEKNT